MVALRWPIVVGWLFCAFAALTWLPPLTSSGSDLDGFAAGNPAVEAELRAFELFGFPLSGRTSLVQRDPGGLSVYAQAEAVLRAAALSQGAYDTPLLGALPLSNAFGAFPGSTENGTTVVTYLFNDPRSSFADQRRAGEAFAAEHLDDPDDAFVGVTGSVPARDAQATIIGENLHTVEIVTVLAIALIVGLTFRSVVAPVVTLLTVGVAVAVTLGIGGYVGRAVGVSVPADLQPLLVALLLGVVTDYCILFLSGLRRRIALGDARTPAATHATSDFGPIVAVAGVTVAAGTGALIVAESALFRGAGPALALAVLIGLVVSLTLVPALMAVVGRWAFWPTQPRPLEHDDETSVMTPLVGVEPVPVDRRPGRVTRLVTSRRSAWATAAVCLVLLGVAALPLTSLRLGLGFVQSLPEDEPVARAAAAAQQGFAPGILSPTELLLEAPGIGAQEEALEDLDAALERAPGVAGVLGPADLPLEDRFDILTTADNAAARYLIVFDSVPLGATAVTNLGELRSELPRLLDAAGLAGAEVAIAGDTALSAGVVQETTDDLLRITVAALGVNLLLLVLFLRALVAPLYLLACSVLGLAAALGLTTLLFQSVLEHDGLTFYVPFTAAVLLLSLGSDYNIFAVGHVWQLAEGRTLRQALLISLPQSTRAITSAGTALAASFGLLALVPLVPFRELAFAMAVGILVDVFVVRALLVPSLLTLIGRWSGWPSSRLAHQGDRTEPEVPEPVPTAGA
jgi:RND superfamily putative drug exporter